MYLLYNYIALVFFVIVAIFVPYSFLLTAKLLRRNIPANPVKNAPYESAAATIGANRDVINDYLPFFLIFIPFEVVSMILVFWSSSARSISLNSNILIIGLAVISLLFALVGYKFIRGKNV